MSDSDQYRRLKDELEEISKFVNRIASSASGMIDTRQLLGDAHKMKRRVDDALGYARRLEDERDDQERKYRRSRRDD